MTISDVLLVMDAERNRTEAFARRKKEDFLRDNAGLSDLLNERKDLLLDMLKNKMNGVSDEKIKGRIESINSLINENYGDWERAFEPEYRCAKCKDTGFEDIDGRKRMCVCLKNLAPVMLYGAREIDSLEGSFESFDENVFKDVLHKKIMNAAKDVALKMTKGTDRNYFVISGKSGLGKSFLMSAMAKRIKQEGRSAVYMDAFDLFGIFHKKRLGEEINTEFIYGADALFVDDLGTEPLTQTVTREYFFELLTQRESDGKITVFTTNLTSVQMMERYTEKVGSRLFSAACGAFITIEGKDLRL